jgi:hypothetical protein
MLDGLLHMGRVAAPARFHLAQDIGRAFARAAHHARQLPGDALVQRGLDVRVRPPATVQDPLRAPHLLQERLSRPPGARAVLQELLRRRAAPPPSCVGARIAAGGKVIGWSARCCGTRTPICRARSHGKLPVSLPPPCKQQPAVKCGTTEMTPVHDTPTPPDPDGNTCHAYLCQVDAPATI